MNHQLQFDSLGFTQLNRVFDSKQCEEILHLCRLSPDAAGSRALLDADWCQRIARTLATHPQIEPLLGFSNTAVQCTLFEKSFEKNWLVPIHQDLSIPVASRSEVPGFSLWSVKENTTFVQAPVSLLEQLVAIRLHLDPCSHEDGPIVVVPKSHKHGIIPTSVAIRMKEKSEFACMAEVGSILVMRPLMLHRSSKGNGRSNRRVLYFLFGPSTLSGGLEWKNAVYTRLDTSGKPDG